MSFEVTEESGYERNPDEDTAEFFQRQILRWLKIHKGNERFSAVLNGGNVHYQLTLTIHQDADGS